MEFLKKKKKILKLFCEVTMKNVLESIDTLYLSHFRKRMKWTKDHDIIFLRELLLFEPWNYKYCSKEIGNYWERISESLNQLTGTSFKVTQRSVQDHYQTLEKTYKKKKNGKKTGKVGSIQKRQKLTLFWQIL